MIRKQSAGKDDPEVLLDGYIKSVVNGELHHAGVMADDGPVNRAPKVVEAIADAKSKNGFSPGGGQGKGKGSSSKQNKGKSKSTKSSAKNNKKASAGKGKGHEAQQELIPPFVCVSFEECACS